MRPMLRLAAAVLALGLAACQTPPRTPAASAGARPLPSAAADTRIDQPRDQAELLAVIAQHHQDVIDASVMLFPRVRSPVWKAYLSDTIKTQANELRQVRALQEQLGGTPREVAAQPFPDLLSGSVVDATTRYQQAKDARDDVLRQQLTAGNRLAAGAQLAGLVDKLSTRLPDEPARLARLGDEDPTRAPAATRATRHADGARHGSARKHQTGSRKAHASAGKKSSKASATRSSSKKKHKK